MGNINKFHKVLITLLALQHCMVNVFGAKKVHVRVVNRLGGGQSMALHCRSKEDDLGNVVLGEEEEAKWRFSVNFFGTTLFYCGVRWRGSDRWYSFDAYNARRDHTRCPSECRWMISKEGTLYGYDEQVGKWILFPLRRVQFEKIIKGRLEKQLFFLVILKENDKRCNKLLNWSFLFYYMK